MKIYLVRHARAVPRKEWRGDPLLRPLSEEGRQQAEALAEQLGSAGISRILASPALRCQQSVESLAAATGVDAEVDERLAEGETVQRMLELMPAFDEGAVLYCTHLPLITALLELFELPEDESDERVPCRKGSIWALEGPGYTPTCARYLEPGARSKHARLRASMPETVRSAVLDLGSTSFNLLIADVSRQGEIHPVVREKFMLRLGAVIASNAHIPADVCARAVAVARDLHEVAEQEKVQRIHPVATSAVRDAENGFELAERIGRALGAPVRILPGEEEARLMMKAFAGRLGLGKGRTLGLDLGGGSLELAVSDRDGIRLEATLPLGVARLHGECIQQDPLRPREAKALRHRVREQLAPWRDRIVELKPRRTIATGGAVRALARLVAEGDASHSRRAAPLTLSRDELRALGKRLAASTHAERLAMRGMRRRRADLLPAAAVILTTLVDELGLGEFVVCDWGLREGVLLDALARDAASHAPAI